MSRSRLKAGTIILQTSMNGELSRHGIKNECNIVVEAVNSLVSSVTIDKFIPSLEVPKYIRDIKDEARTLFGVKGTNRLNRYLDGKQLFTVFYNSARRMLLE